MNNKKNSPFVCPNDGEILTPITNDDTKPKPGQWFEAIFFCPKCDYIKRMKAII